jgi:uncharacterized protein YndB with AHSA1/START domain
LLVEIVREIELEAAPADVWSALTDEAQLEEWFANEVELDPTPGGRGVFRWDNGEVREAVVEAVEEGSRIVLRFEDDGVVDLRVEPAETGSRVLVREQSPSWSTSLELHASAWRQSVCEARVSHAAAHRRRSTALCAAR